MPVPVSRTEHTTRLSSSLGRALTVTVPSPGIASTALITRFTRICSIRVRLTVTHSGSSPSSSTQSTRPSLPACFNIAATSRTTASSSIGAPRSGPGRASCIRRWPCAVMCSPPRSRSGSTWRISSSMFSCAASAPCTSSIAATWICAMLRSSWPPPPASVPSVARREQELAAGLLELLFERHLRSAQGFFGLAPAVDLRFFLDQQLAELADIARDEDAAFQHAGRIEHRSARDRHRNLLTALGDEPGLLAAQDIAVLDPPAHDRAKP